MQSRYEGRIGRLRYLGMMIGATIAGSVIVALWNVLVMPEVEGGAGIAALFIILLFQSIFIVRRLHDLDRSGAHYWLLLVPVYNLYLGLLLLFKKGTVGLNRFGEDPLASYGGEEGAAYKESEVITSSTPENPRPRDLYRTLLTELASGAGQFVTFQFKAEGGGDDIDEWVQVTLGEGNSINLHYPFDGEPEELLRQKGVSLPEGSELLQWEKQTAAEFAIPEIEVEQIVACVDSVFTKLLGISDSRPVNGWID
ncbi:DUF805 domain-containing protein [Candidatus Latescibacterota bacterium]